MFCPLCHNSTIVKDSRSPTSKTVIRRRRYCTKCKFRFTTVEQIYYNELQVIKRSGIKKAFDKEKISKSISTALRKRNYSFEQILNLSERVIKELKLLGLSLIPTRKIGEIILKCLAEYDEVGYIRFASVYKDFTSAKDFANFINKLK